MLKNPVSMIQYLLVRLKFLILKIADLYKLIKDITGQIQSLHDKISQMVIDEPIKHPALQMCQKFENTLDHEIRMELYALDDKFELLLNNPEIPVIKIVEHFDFVYKWLNEEMKRYTKLKESLGNNIKTDAVYLLLTTQEEKIMQIIENIIHLNIDVKKKVESPMLQMR